MLNLKRLSAILALVASVGFAWVVISAHPEEVSAAFTAPAGCEPAAGHGDGSGYAASLRPVSLRDWMTDDGSEVGYRIEPCRTEWIRSNRRVCLQWATVEYGLGGGSSRICTRPVDTVRWTPVLVCGSRH